MKMFKPRFCRDKSKTLDSLAITALHSFQLSVIRGGCCTGDDDDGEIPPDPPPKSAMASNMGVLGG